MTGFKRFIAVSLLLMLLPCIPAVAAAADESLVAKVGSVPITIHELSRRFQKILPLSGSFHGGVAKERVSEIRAEALADLVEQAYKVHYGFDNAIPMPVQEVDRVYKGIVERFESKEEFVNALGNESENDLRAAILREEMAKKAEKVAVEDRIAVDEAPIRAEFEKNRHRYVRPRQFEASHILINIRPELTDDEKQEKELLVESLYERAKGGEDFYNLAYHNSEARTKMVGGKLPPFHLGQMQPEIEAAIIKMKPGEVSAPIRTFYGYEIILLKSDTPETQLTYDDMRTKLFGEERDKQRKALKEAWLAELKKKYKVEYFQK